MENNSEKKSTENKNAAGVLCN